MYEASPLDEKQLFDMKDYFTQNRFKFLGGAVLFFAVLSLGAYCRPAYDFAFSVLVPEPKVYVAEKSDVEKEVDTYLSSSEFQSEYRAEAEARVKLKIATKLSVEAQKAAQMASQYEMRALNGISGDTATATIALEKAQGRRK